MAKLNDFLYLLEGEKNYLTWREVCEWRREFGTTKIVAKKPLPDYWRTPSNTACTGQLAGAGKADDLSLPSANCQ